MARTPGEAHKVDSRIAKKHAWSGVKSLAARQNRVTVGAMNRLKMDRRWLPLNALRAFEAVAKHGSFTGAANALLISQSALSRHVISLEKLIGVQLFERRPHSLVLTKAGQHLLPAVAKSFDRLEYSLDEIKSSGAPTLR